MTHKTVEAILQPDGHILLPREELPNQPVRVMVTFLDQENETGLSEPGDYLEQLTDYEERLARGEIKWQ